MVQGGVYLIETVCFESRPFMATNPMGLIYIFGKSLFRFVAINNIKIMSNTHMYEYNIYVSFTDHVDDDCIHL